MITSDSAVDLLTFPKLDYVDPVSSTCCSRPNFITSDARNETVYWTDTTVERPAIYMSKLRDSPPQRQPQVFLDTGIMMPEGIAFDWKHHNLYFADSKLRKIFVCTQKIPTICAVVIQEDFDNKPCGIAFEIDYECENIYFKISPLK